MTPKDFLMQDPKIAEMVDNGYDIRLDEEEILKAMEDYASLLTNDFDKLKSMCKHNDKRIRMSNTLVSAQKVKAGGHVTMGVDEETVIDLTLSEKYVCALYVIDYTEFKKLK